MPYSLELDESCVQFYIRNRTDLSRLDRIKIHANLNDLRETADTYRDKPYRRLTAQSPFF
jgi:hypothetical protein